MVSLSVVSPKWHSITVLLILFILLGDWSGCSVMELLLLYPQTWCTLIETIAEKRKGK